MQYSLVCSLGGISISISLNEYAGEYKYKLVPVDPIVRDLLIADDEFKNMPAGFTGLAPDSKEIRRAIKFLLDESPVQRQIGEVMLVLKHDHVLVKHKHIKAHVYFNHPQHDEPTTPIGEKIKSLIDLTSLKILGVENSICEGDFVFTYKQVITKFGNMNFSIKMLNQRSEFYIKHSIDVSIDELPNSLDMLVELPNRAIKRFSNIRLFCELHIGGKHINTKWDSCRIQQDKDYKIKNFIKFVDEDCVYKVYDFISVREMCTDYVFFNKLPDVPVHSKNNTKSSSH